ncbi:MAG: ABC transporter substrate-binding protein [Thermoplasmata archaeon]
MAEGGAPPPGAMRGGVGTGVVATIAVVVLVVGFVGGIFAAPVIFPPDTAPPPEPPVLGDSIVVGTNTPFAPFEFRDLDGILVGFTVDLVEEVGSRAGLTIIWNDYTDWDTLLAAGEVGAVNMIASSMTITEARDVVYDFSTSYYSANQAVLVHTSSSLTCSGKTCTATDLEGLTWVVQTGTTSMLWVNDVLGEECATGGPLFCFDDVPTVITTVRTGGADVAIMDLPPAVTFAGQPANELVAIGKIVTNELYGMAVEQGDPLGILPIINPIIQALESEGFILNLAELWGVPTEVP